MLVNRYRLLRSQDLLAIYLFPRCSNFHIILILFHFYVNFLYLHQILRMGARLLAHVTVEHLEFTICLLAILSHLHGFIENNLVATKFILLRLLFDLERTDVFINVQNRLFHVLQIGEVVAYVVKSNIILIPISLDFTLDHLMGKVLRDALVLLTYQFLPKCVDVLLYLLRGLLLNKLDNTKYAIGEISLLRHQEVKLKFNIRVILLGVFTKKVLRLIKLVQFYINLINLVVSCVLLVLGLKNLLQYGLLCKIFLKLSGLRTHISLLGF